MSGMKFLRCRGSLHIHQLAQLHPQGAADGQQGSDGHVAAHILDAAQV